MNLEMSSYVSTKTGVTVAEWFLEGYGSNFIGKTNDGKSIYLSDKTLQCILAAAIARVCNSKEEENRVFKDLVEKYVTEIVTPVETGIEFLRVNFNTSLTPAKVDYFRLAVKKEFNKLADLLFVMIIENAAMDVMRFISENINHISMQHNNFAEGLNSCYGLNMIQPKISPVFDIENTHLLRKNLLAKYEKFDRDCEILFFKAILTHYNLLPALFTFTNPK